MYYPYLRARQFELIALRELVQEDALQGRVTPIFEPVKKTFNNFDIAYKIFSENKQQAFIIVNANVGELSDPTGHKQIADYILSKSPDCSLFKPAFHYSDKPGLAAEILEMINSRNFSNCLLICKNDIDYEAPIFNDLINDDRITAFNIDDPGRSRGLLRRLLSTRKALIRIDDLFETQPRNSEFLNIDEHRFSEEHLYYKREGFMGFSDFTVLPSGFSEGGSTPRAVVIHLTFKKENGEFWIRHFTSDTNDSIANVQGKFKEAAEKAINFCRDNNYSNSAITELEEYFDTQHYPGLGTVKKISIKNHILLVSEYLRLNP